METGRDIMLCLHRLFDQAQIPSIGNEGLCFRLAVKWAALVLADEHPGNRGFLNIPYWTPPRLEKAKKRQVEYAGMSKITSVGPINAQQQMARYWIEAALRKRQREALVETSIVDFDTKQFKDFCKSDGTGDVAGWAQQSLQDGWHALLLSSGNHTVAVARQRVTGTIYGFDPNFGVVSAEKSDEQIHMFLEDFLKLLEQRELPLAVSWLILVSVKQSVSH